MDTLVKMCLLFSPINYWICTTSWFVDLMLEVVSIIIVDLFKVFKSVKKFVGGFIQSHLKRWGKGGEGGIGLIKRNVVLKNFMTRLRIYEGADYV